MTNIPIAYEIGRSMMISTKNAKRAGAVLALVASAVLAACSSSGSTSSTNGSSTNSSGGAASGSGTSGSPVVVGVPYPIQTQATAPTPEIGLAVAAMVKWVNAHGGIKGHPIQAVSCDDHFTSTGTASCVQQFAGNSNMVALVGGDDCFADAANALLKSSGLPWLASYGCSANSYTSSEFTLLGGGVVADALAVGTLIAQEKTPAEIITFNLPQADVIVSSTTASAAAAGGKVLGAVRVDPAAVDMTAAVAEALKSHPQAIVPETSSAQIASTVQALKQDGFTGKIILAATEVPANTLASLNGASGQIIGASSTAPVEAPGASLPAITEFRTEMAAQGATTSQMTSQAFETWLAFHQFYDAAQKVTSVTRANILTASRGLANWQYEQSNPPMTFSAPGPFTGFPNIVMHWAAFMTVQNNHWVWDGKWTNLATSGG
jgi:branched-chain amino acid transport system substrate-binding protein